MFFIATTKDGTRIQVESASENPIQAFTELLFELRERQLYGNDREHEIQVGKSEIDLSEVSISQSEKGDGQAVNIKLGKFDHKWGNQCPIRRPAPPVETHEVRPILSIGKKSLFIVKSGGNYGITWPGRRRLFGNLWWGDLRLELLSGPNWKWMKFKESTNSGHGFQWLTFSMDHEK